MNKYTLQSKSETNTIVCPNCRQNVIPSNPFACYLCGYSEELLMKFKKGE